MLMKQPLARKACFLPALAVVCMAMLVPLVAAAANVRSGSCDAARPASNCVEQAKTPVRDGNVFIARSRHMFAREMASDDPKIDKGCNELINHGTHFSIDIEVGTPGQKFTVVADTGSNTLIVPSCICQESGSCYKDDRCFKGTNHSSSFALVNGTNGPQGMLIQFGSGMVRGVIAKDNVTVGRMNAFMNKGLLLMTDQALNFPGPFEGILGLGIPQEQTEERKLSKTEERVETKDTSSANGSSDTKGIVPEEEDLGNVMKKIIKEIIEGSDSGIDDGKSSAEDSPPVYIEIDGAAPVAFRVSRGLNHWGLDPSHRDRDGHTTSQIAKPVGFLQEADVGRFSMCFNEGKNGVLRLGTPEVKLSHGSVGRKHWGVGFRGVSVGNLSATLEFCASDNMTDEQSTPCGAIPDSGTTAIMAPQEHIDSVLEAICDGWKRCTANYTAMLSAAEDARKAAEKAYGFDAFGIEAASKVDVLKLLLVDCNVWLENGEELNELPALHFHVEGSNGTVQKLTLPGRGYIIEQMHEDVKYLYKHVDGIGDIPTGVNHTGHKRKVCSPAFSAMDYKTRLNGPVWILGTPFFYQFNVGYDLLAKPPAVSFTSVEEAPCGSCKADAGLITSASVSRRPRWVSGPQRLPSIDFNEPL